MAIRRKGEKRNGQKTSKSRSRDQYTAVLKGLREVDYDEFVILQRRVSRLEAKMAHERA
ncbi:MAG: hypothetical protein HYU35_02115 [Parcubacteria group bacterium]|nr:hypothetical protein [Parcubacteria group bacterium]